MNNEHYKMLNDRFDARAALLRQAGMSYVHIEEYNTAVFTIKKPVHKRPLTFSASLVMNADEIVWADKLAELIRYNS